MTCMMHSPLLSLGAEQSSVGATRSLFVESNRIVVHELTLQPGEGPTTLHTHGACETLCVIVGTLGVLRLQRGSASQERVSAGATHVIPAHVPHVVINIGTVPARFLTSLALPVCSRMNA